MTYSFGPPVFGFIQELIWLVIVVVSVITWIIRTVQGNNQQLPPPVQRPGRRRDERGDDEIDSFLEQVNRNQAPARSSRSEESRNQPPANRSKPAAPPPTPAKKRQPSRPLSESFPAAPASGQAADSLASRRSTGGQDLSQGMKQHLQEYMGERVQKEAQKDLGPSLSQKSTLPQKPSNSQSTSGAAPVNLGSFRAAPPVQASQTPAQMSGAASPEAATTARSLAQMNNLRQALRNPQMIKQAVIVQEILAKPRSLRK